MKKNTSSSQKKQKTQSAKRPKRFPLTDSGNAEYFATLYQNELRYDHSRKRWLLWRTHWWVDDVDAEVRRRAKNAVRLMRDQAGQNGDEELREKVKAWARKCEARQKLDAMVSIAQSEKPLADSGQDWNSDPWLLGVANGIVDLRTGKLRKGRQIDRITAHTDVPFDPKAKCLRWDKFINDVFGGDPELIDFVHRVVGYSLSGDTSEQCLALLYGTGANGKSTFLDALRVVWGSYGQNMPFSALDRKARNSIPNEIAALAGKRLVTASETSEAASLNEERVKALTGCDAITARFLYGEFFTFVPDAKFWLAVNHLPGASDESDGFWRRIRVIPFVQKFTGMRRDKKLLEKLRAEAPGILAWAVKGCRAWQERGLEAPESVKEATQSYREENDILGDFIEQCCVVHENARVPVSCLYDAFKDWSDEMGEGVPLDRRLFGQRIQAKGFVKKRYGHNRTWTWFGICRCIDAEAQKIAA